MHAADDLRAAVRRINLEGAAKALFSEYADEFGSIGLEMQVIVQIEDHGALSVDVQVVAKGRPVFGESL